MTYSPALLAEFAPTGVLRASINLGNPILANRKEGGEVFGVSVDLARELATRLGAELALVVVDGAAKSVDAVKGLLDACREKTLACLRCF